MHIRVIIVNLVLTACLCMLTSCATKLAVDVSPDQGPVARLRVMPMVDNTYFYLYPNQGCYTPKSKSAIPAHTGGHDYSVLNPLFFLGENKKIGMPPTSDMSWKYHEFMVAAHKPLIVMTYFLRQGEVNNQYHKTSCGPILAKLNLESNKDYDAALIIEPGRCYLRVRELVADTSNKTKVSATEIPAEPASKCEE